jgi:hypothetical protein
MTRDFLDPVPGSGRDAPVLQQSSKPAGENWSFDPEGLHLIYISVHLLVLVVARGRVLFVGLVLYVMVLRLLLLLSRRVLSRWLSGTTSSISKGFSSGDASCGMSGWDSWGCGMF